MVGAPAALAAGKPSQSPGVVVEVGGKWAEQGRGGRGEEQPPKGV